jgi:hypothetical protein
MATTTRLQLNIHEEAKQPAMMTTKDVCNDGYMLRIPNPNTMAVTKKDNQLISEDVISSLEISM